MVYAVRGIGWRGADSSVKDTLYNVIKNLIRNSINALPAEENKMNFFLSIKEGDYILQVILIQAGDIDSQAYCMLEELKREGFLANFYEVTVMTVEKAWQVILTL